MRCARVLIEINNYVAHIRTICLLNYNFAGEKCPLTIARSRLTCAKKCVRADRTKGIHSDDNNN